MLNSKKQASQLQNEVINALKNGNSFEKVMDENKDIIIQWYVLGKKGNVIFINFYNQLNSSFSDELIMEDIKTLKESIEFNNKYFLNRDNLLLFNSPKTVDEWYKKGRDGDEAFKPFYTFVRQHAFKDILNHDDKIILSLLKKGKTLDEALNSSKIFSTKNDFKNHEHPSLRQSIEKHNMEVIIKGLEKGELFDELIKKENVYSNPEKIIELYNLGRLNSLEYKEFYKEAFPFVIKQDYNKISNALDKGYSLEEIAKLPNVISSDEEFREYITGSQDSNSKTYESNLQNKILRECLSGTSFNDAINQNNNMPLCSTTDKICKNIDHERLLKKLEDCSEAGWINKRDQVKIWYKLGKAGNSRYKPFFDEMSQFVLRDDCKIVFNAIKNGKTFNEALQEDGLMCSSDFLCHVYTNDEFESLEIKELVNKTIELLISCTDYSINDFNFNANNNNVKEWVKLGKMGIKPFNEFYNNYSIFKTQYEVIHALSNNELFINAVTNVNLPYSQDQIFDWYYKGQSGEKYIEFYKICSYFTKNETKSAIINSLAMNKTLSQSIEENTTFHSKGDINSWLHNDQEFYNQCYEVINGFKERINSLDELLTGEIESKLKSTNLTADDYDEIMGDIYKIGKNTAKFEENDTIFEKISKIVNAYVPWSYKSKGGELGYYKSNFIKLDDRLLDSQKISTLIHELTHHLVAEFIEGLMCRLLDVEKSQAVEGFVAYFLTDPLTKVMNEFCASTVEGRFIPLGYQNYGAFNIAMESCGVDDGAKEVWKYIGNTIADDIIKLLEGFISQELREDIKTQFKEDMFPPNYLEVGFECLDVLSKEVVLDSLCYAIVDYYNLAKDSDEHKRILNIAYSTFNESYQ